MCKLHGNAAVGMHEIQKLFNERIVSASLHYENMPMQYTDLIENFTSLKKMIFIIFLLRTYIVGTC